MHIADVHLVGTRQHAFRDRMTAADHDVVSRYVELFDRKRHQRQPRTILLACERQLLDERGRYRLAAHEAAIVEKIDEAEQVRVWKDRNELLQPRLGAAVRDK